MQIQIEKNLRFSMFPRLQEAASWKILKFLINIDLLYCSLGHHWKVVEVRQIYYSHTLIHHTKFQAACSKILWWNLENIQGFVKLNLLPCELLIPFWQLDFWLFLVTKLQNYYTIVCLLFYWARQDRQNRNLK